MDLWRKFIYCTSLSGYILGTVDHMQPQGNLSSLFECGIYNNVRFNAIKIHDTNLPIRPSIFIHKDLNFVEMGLSVFSRGKNLVSSVIHAK